MSAPPIPNGATPFGAKIEFLESTAFHFAKGTETDCGGPVGVARSRVATHSPL